ncbi:hypothetical protein LV779_14905 [Streptomyces thinghirensis]|nr:hypothetical protein [Streptomyces thinghirensis]
MDPHSSGCSWRPCGTCSNRAASPRRSSSGATAAASACTSAPPPDVPAADASEPVLAALTSSASCNLIANRVSHFFGLEGPSLAVDSMCTSSAMAVHLACADLLRGECELAVAGGVNLTVHEDKYVALSEMQLLGSHPGARAASATATATCPPGRRRRTAQAAGRGAARRRHRPRRHQEHVVLHAGRSSGFMTPSHRTQVTTMRRALERAGAEPAPSATSSPPPTAPRSPTRSNCARPARSVLGRHHPGCRSAP